MNHSSKRVLINDLTPKELLVNVYISQGFFIVIAAVIAWFFHVPFPWNNEISLTSTGFLLGGITGLLFPFLSIILKKRIPDHYLDDGGINDKIFSSLSYPHIFILTLIIAFAEEWLFRGVLQSLLGLMITSLMFSLLHVRYIKKPLLLGIVTLLSFWLGLIYEWTESIWIPFLAHFLIDFISGCWIAKEHRRAKEDNEKGE
ncbi:CPBP family intramembrane glutamic endopeptidase [Fictibacillus phosphorivorans]|uniref:CPBP family intramembrane glutamic endopeptidase n=1 Tax=Fictibacillus phosphorivorans TaxID=1221500 RepID=UPI00203AADEF|nr:type II CAAX endopeptidase family protein [Fictibacillus phosphorivorans]MCM3720312.1 CPBP family intramembrane metalloprotease [Fictibacillus phosphorivorans]MCM3778002.1 CPBP family intramembrane metalloprotease [Fictibacillus phosphorivorans]